MRTTQYPTCAARLRNMPTSYAQWSAVASLALRESIRIHMTTSRNSRVGTVCPPLRAMAREALAAMSTFHPLPLP